MGRRSTSFLAGSDIDDVPSLHDLEREEQMLQEEEDEEVARKKEAAAQLAAEMGLAGTSPGIQSVPELKPEVAEDEVYEGDPGKNVSEEPMEEVSNELHVPKTRGAEDAARSPKAPAGAKPPENPAFVPARLPHFQ
jgi:hypothetical protein